MKKSFVSVAVLAGLLMISAVPAAFAEFEPDQQDAPPTPQQMRSVRHTSAYANGSALMQQFLEDLVVTSDAELLRNRWPRGFFAILPNQFGVKSLLELLQKREAAAFAAARAAVGYASRNATFQSVFDQMLQGALGKKVDEDSARLNNWVITKNSLVNAQVAADLASGGSSGRALAGDSAIDFNGRVPTPTTPSSGVTALTGPATQPAQGSPAQTTLIVNSDIEGANAASAGPGHPVQRVTPNGGSEIYYARGRVLQSPALSGGATSDRGAITTVPVAANPGTSDASATSEASVEPEASGGTVTPHGEMRSKSIASPTSSGTTVGSAVGQSIASPPGASAHEASKTSSVVNVEKGTAFRKTGKASASDGSVPAPESVIDGSQVAKEIAFKKALAKKSAKVARAKAPKRRTLASKSGR